MATTEAVVTPPSQEIFRSSFDPYKVREDFPILKQKVHGKPLVYLDNAATTQKPKAVVKAMRRFYTRDCSNIHRGVHTLSERSTKAYEDVRIKVQRFINAADSREIVFVRGTTEAINLVATSFGRKNIQKGDEIIISGMEHHSNIVPWQLLCEDRDAALRVIPINDDGEIIFDEFEKLLNPRTKLVSVVHVSNVLGTINPVRRMIEAAHRANVPVLLDGAQAAPRLHVDVQELDCDFYAFSGHKLCAPTGIGVLYGKEKYLESMPPFMGGGDMISSVTFEKTLYNTIPYKFEAGTPNIGGTIGLGAALDYLNELGLENLARYEGELLCYTLGRLSGIPGVRILGNTPHRAGAVSFVLDGIHPHDVGTILDQEGIAVRTGHHCAQPLMERFGVPATVRASLAFYNTKEDIDRLVAGIYKVKEFMG